MKFRKLFGYPGGQKRLLPILLKLLPDHEDYIEIFGGGCTLCLNKEPSKFEVINDVDSDLTNLFRVVKEDFDGFSKEVEFFLQSREMFGDFKKELSELSDVQKAAAYFYMLRTSFDGKAEHFSVKKRSGKAKSSAFKYQHEIKAIHNRLKNVVIENMDFAKLIEKYDDEDAFLFADPPYFGITGLYRCDFTRDDHIRFFKALKDVQAKFLVTYGDHDFIRMIWRKFVQVPVVTQGSMGTQEKRKKVPHILIANYDIKDLHFKPFQATYFRF